MNATGVDEGGTKIAAAVVSLSWLARCKGGEYVLCPPGV